MLQLLQIYLAYLVCVSEIQCFIISVCYSCCRSTWHTWSVSVKYSVLLICLCVLQLLQIYQAKLAYLGWINLIEWTTYITALLLVISFNECQRQTGYRYVSGASAFVSFSFLTETFPYSSPSTVIISEEKRFNFRLKCRKKSIIVEELYLNLEDLKQSKSDRGWGGGGEEERVLLPS